MEVLLVVQVHCSSAFFMMKQFPPVVRTLTGLIVAAKRMLLRSRIVS